MNQIEIREIIIQNLTEFNIETDDVRIQPDSSGSWRIVVVSDDFLGKTFNERKSIVLDNLEEISIEWLDLLTSEEKEWAGSLPQDVVLEGLPLWPEALERSHAVPEEIIFPSDLDTDLERPITATFYSLRGGVGRSTSLAYTARILARRGRSVLCVDMDLEAPGLASLFGKESEVRDDSGLLQILIALDQGDSLNIQEHIIRVLETEELYCLPAGKPNANYARLLSFMNPEAWYREERNPLREFVDILSNGLSFKPDVILFDARTGITPLNAPLLFDLSDIATIVFFPHPQAKVGTSALVKAVLSSKTRRGQKNLTPELRFIVSPIPSTKAKEIVEKYQHRALEWIGDWISVTEEKRSIENRVIEADITHFIPYRESIATSDEVLADREVWQNFEPVADWFELFLPSQSRISPQVEESQLSKEEILRELFFSTGTAEHQDEKFLENFVSTDTVNRALQPSIPLVIGRKGTGKTAIFRRIAEGSQRPSVKVISPSPLKNNSFWVIGTDGFKEIDKILENTEYGWREFWLLYTCYAFFLSQPQDKYRPSNDILLNSLDREFSSEIDIIQSLESIFSKRRIGLLGKAWLESIDSQSSEEVILLFDGLDTGFGNKQEDRVRRLKAIEGLFSLLTDMADNLRSLKFKVFLREDIWRKLRFENKSHFFGRSIVLAWENQADFFKVAIKQAINSSESFRQLTALTLVGSSSGGNLLENYDYWVDGQVYEIWNLLVGERMKGSQSTFTRNWVWSRLADGDNNRSPRTLLQLFELSRRWELQEQQKSPYDKTIIRPRALSKCLENVSIQALDAIKEEFSDLDNLIDRLRQLGRTPFESTEVDGFNDALGLALEVGLLAVYEEIEGKVIRYKVPDIYRYGINMTRKGQA